VAQPIIDARRTTLPDLLIAHAEARLRQLGNPIGVTVECTIEWQAAEYIKPLEAALRAWHNIW
jgi:hypothetical protein